MTPEREALILRALRERISQRGIARALKVGRQTVRAVDGARRAKKGADRLHERAGGTGPVCLPASEGDVIEFDELCLRQSPPLWLWVGVSRRTRQVLGLALGDRSDETLARAWAQVPTDYWGRPVYTDHWGAYARLLPGGQHHPCDKGTGLTSVVEGLNTKWRQRQSGLVRRSCGVHPKIGTDLAERFRLLVDEHNRQGARRWKRRQDEDTTTTQSNP